jgi:adenylate cyclase
MTAESINRKLTAILSADAKGYSRLMGEDEVSTVQLLKECREIMAKLIQQHRGRVVDSPGDNLLAEFGSVVDATGCAVKIQEALQIKNAELSENKRLEFRIGINLGDVLEDVDRIYGDGVNIAARIEGLADPGGICISRTAYDQIKNKLELGYEYLGEHSVKNIAEPVRVYRVLAEPEAAGKVIGEKRFLGRFSRKTAMATIIILVIVAGGLIGWNLYLQRSKKVEPASLDKMTYPLPDKPSIAVLAFDNLSGDTEQEYFSDGLTEEIITALSKSTQIFVIARNSSFTYKGKPVKVQQVSEELGVRYVLEGSVRKDMERVRITAQLIDAVKGIHLWAERYDRDLKDIFAIQDDITKQIIAALHVKLTIGEDARIIAGNTNSLDAYMKYLQSREYHMRMNKEANLTSRRLLEEAISIDPEYGTAYALLGATHMLDVFLQATNSPNQSLGKAIELEQKAIALGADAHGVLGFLYTIIRQHDKAIAECQQAVELNPNSATARTFYGLALNLMGRFEEAVHELEQGVRLDPFSSSFSLRSLALAYCNVGRSEEAIEICKKAIQKAPDDLIARIIFIQAYSLAGQQEEAQKEAEEVLRINPNFSLESYAKTLGYKNQAYTDRVIATLRAAGLK